MRLREIAATYFKARVVSWLCSSYVTAFHPSPAGPVTLAVFFNGRYYEPDVPDGVPADWQKPPDGAAAAE